MIGKEEARSKIRNFVSVVNSCLAVTRILRVSILSAIWPLQICHLATIWPLHVCYLAAMWVLQVYYLAAIYPL
jgi:hypothetical protein